MSTTRGQGRPIKVLLCTTGFPRSGSDPHKPFLLDHAKALNAGGAEVTVLCPSAPGLPHHEEVEGVEVVRFRYAPGQAECLAYDGAMYKRVATASAALIPGFVSSFAASAVAVAKRRGVDVVHGHWWVPSGAVALATARSTGALAAVHLHGSDTAMTRGPLRRMAQYVLGSADVVMAVSPELASWGERTSGRALEIIPMPIRLDPRLAPTEPPARGPILGVGRLVPEKGFDLLIRAVAALGEELVLLGDGPERRRLEELAVSTGATVRFVGEVAPDEVGVHYQAARIVAVPSRREGFGMVAAEAAACGRAVVGTRVGGLPQIVADGVSGRLVAPDDLGALAEALRSVEAGMGAQGPRLIEHLRADRHADQVVGLYREALARGASRPVG